MPRFKNPGPGPVSLASGRVLDVGETVVLDNLDADESVEDRATVTRGALIPVGEDAEASPATLSDGELAVWVQNHKVGDVIDAAGDNKDLAERLLAAENLSTEPRNGVVKGLTAITEEPA